MVQENNRVNFKCISVPSCKDTTVSQSNKCLKFDFSEAYAIECKYLSGTLETCDHQLGKIVHKGNFNQLELIR